MLALELSCVSEIFGRFLEQTRLFESLVQELEHRRCVWIPALENDDD
jgi:hypothetical protein